MIRSKDKVLPLFVSPGHRCDQATATRLTLACLRGYKLPEPTRLAVVRKRSGKCPYRSIYHVDGGSILEPLSG